MSQIARHNLKSNPLRREVAAWEVKRNARDANIDWQFTTDDARIKLKNLYPTL